MSNLETEGLHASAPQVLDPGLHQTADVFPAQVVAHPKASFPGKEHLTEAARILGGSGAAALVAAALAVNLPIVIGAGIAGAMIGYLIKHVDEDKVKGSGKPVAAATQ